MPTTSDPTGPNTSDSRVARAAFRKNIHRHYASPALTRIQVPHTRSLFLDTLRRIPHAQVRKRSCYRRMDLPGCPMPMGINYRYRYRQRLRIRQSRRIPRETVQDQPHSDQRIQFESQRNRRTIALRCPTSPIQSRQTVIRHDGLKSHTPLCGPIALPLDDAWDVLRILQ